MLSSRPGSPASSEPTVWHAVPGAGSITSRPTSGPRWWHTTWCCSPVSNQHSPRPRPAASMTAGHIKSACPPPLAKRFLRPPPLLQRENGEPPPTTAQPSALLHRQKTCVYGRALATDSVEWNDRELLLKMFQ